MSLSVNSVSFAGTEPHPSQVKTAGGVQNTNLLKQCGPKVKKNKTLHHGRTLIRKKLSVLQEQKPQAGQQPCH